MRSRCGFFLKDYWLWLDGCSTSRTLGEALGGSFVDLNRRRCIGTQQCDRKIDERNCPTASTLAGRVCTGQPDGNAEFLGKTTDHEEAEIRRRSVREVHRILQPIVHLGKRSPVHTNTLVNDRQAVVGRRVLSQHLNGSVRRGEAAGILQQLRNQM